MAERHLRRRQVNTAVVIQRALPESTRSDPELIGFMLREMVAVPTGDVQDLPRWRRLVVEVGAALHEETLQLIMPMTLLEGGRGWGRRRRWRRRRRAVWWFWS
jgi:hypothetical protein